MQPDLATTIVDCVGAPVYLFFSGILLFAALIIGTRVFHLAEKRRFGLRSGLLYGFLMSLWSSGCWLAVPYLGAYPNLPWILLVNLANPDAAWETWEPHAMLMAISLLAWILLGALFSWLAVIDKARSA